MDLASLYELMGAFAALTIIGGFIIAVFFNL